MGFSQIVKFVENHDQHALLCRLNVYDRPTSDLLSLFTGLSLLYRPLP